MLRRSDKVAKYINLFVGLIFAFLGLKILYDLLA
jgi:threonine/homoserine/homoserine lactone efflux protein